MRPHTVTAVALLQEDVFAADLDGHFYHGAGARWLCRRNLLRFGG